MRKKAIVMLGVLFLMFAVLYADGTREIWIEEDFSSTTFPPQGWSISAQATNWSRFAGNSAGGTSPELRFSWTPQFNAQSHFISPMLDTSGESTLLLDFRHFVDHYATPYSLGVATRSGSGAWNTVWSANPTANIGPELRTVTISNADVGSAEFQFAFFFNGNSYNIDYWFIDDIKLYTPFPYDLAIPSAPGSSQVEHLSYVTPSCIVKNVGMYDLTATVSLDVYQWENLVASHPDYFSAYLSAGQQETAVFPDFFVEYENEMYRFHYSVSSLEDVIDGDPENNILDKWINTWSTPKQQVLLEIGTGGWCPYCPGAAMAADDFIDQSYNVAVIENHNGDPYANDDSNARNSYYGITGYPTGVFDGLLRYVGGNNTTSVFPSYLPLYQERAPIKTPISLDIYGEVTRDTYDMTIRINKHANLVNPNLVLHFAITESEIPYNWQGQTEFNFVNQMMVPSHLGTPIDLFNAGIGHINVPLSFVKNANWNDYHCELVAFVQDLDTKEVIQAQKVAMLDLELPPVANDDNGIPAIMTALIGNHPNPFNPETEIRFSLKDAAPVRVDIYNIKGQIVKTLVNESKESGIHSATWNGTDDQGRMVSSGVYWYKMSSGKFSSTKKMILMK